MQQPYAHKSATLVYNLGYPIGHRREKGVKAAQIMFWVKINFA
jgi:hypothetical protein